MTRLDEESVRSQESTKRLKDSGIVYFVILGKGNLVSPQVKAEKGAYS